jgi:hypothetical protein
MVELSKASPSEASLSEASSSDIEKKRRVVGEEQGSNGISVLVSNGNDLGIHVEPTS